MVYDTSELWISEAEAYKSARSRIIYTVQKDLKKGNQHLTTCRPVQTKQAQNKYVHKIRQKMSVRATVQEETPTPTNTSGS